MRTKSRQSMRRQRWTIKAKVTGNEESRLSVTGLIKVDGAKNSKLVIKRVRLVR